MICAANPAYPHFRGSVLAGDDFIDCISLKNWITFVISAGDDEWLLMLMIVNHIMNHPGELLWSLGTMNETCERPWRSSPPVFPRPSSSYWRPSRYLTLFRSTTTTFSPIMVNDGTHQVSVALDLVNKGKLCEKLAHPYECPCLFGPGPGAAGRWPPLPCGRWWSW